jgi:hypothetical protein
LTGSADEGATRTMADDQEYIELPEEDEQVFLQLEKKFRSELNEELRLFEEREQNGYPAYLSYINRTVAAAKTLHIAILRDFEIPSHRVDIMDAPIKNFTRL